MMKMKTIMIMIIIMVIYYIQIIILLFYIVNNVNHDHQNLTHINRVPNNPYNSTSTKLPRFNFDEFANNPKITSEYRDLLTMMKKYIKYN
jgi:hypothetical protein